MIHAQNNSRLSKGKEIALWTFQIVTAAAFLMAGLAKLSGQPMMVDVFQRVGVGQWFRYITGGIEVLSAVLLLIPRFTPVGAALLVCTMLGAAITHLAVIGGSPVPPLVLGVLAGIILWGRFGRIVAIFGKDSFGSPTTTRVG